MGVSLKIPGGGGSSKRRNGEGGGGGPGVCAGNLGGGGEGAEAPFTAKMSPVFGENAFFSGKSKRGLSKGGLSPKGANRAKKGPFGAISALPPRGCGVRRDWSRSAPNWPRSALE